MRIQVTPSVCSACDAQFELETVVDAPVTLFLASLKSARCPNCGSKKINLITDLEKFNAAREAKSSGSNDATPLGRNI